MSVQAVGQIRNHKKVPVDKYENWQSESDRGSTTRLDSQDISIARVQCTE